MKLNFMKIANPPYLFSPSKVAYTLAEVLIVIGILGIIAEVVLPSFIQNFTLTSWMRAKDNFEMLTEEATKEMNIAGVLEGYSSNDSFADEFQKYIKVIKRCTSSNLNECFVANFRDTSGKIIPTNAMVTGKNLGHATYTSNLVGLRLINGTNVVLAFDPDCTPPSWYDTKGVGAGVYDPNAASSSQNFTAGPTTACIAALYDINGNQGPNQIGKDIGSLNSTVSITDCIQIGGFCLTTSNVTYSYIDTTADQTWDSDYTSTTDYWAGARKACNDLGMHMPTQTEFDSIEAAYTADTPAGVKAALDASGYSGAYISASEYFNYGYWQRYCPTKWAHGTWGSKGGTSDKLRCIR